MKKLLVIATLSIAVAAVIKRVTGKSEMLLNDFDLKMKHYLNQDFVSLPR